MKAPVTLEEALIRLETDSESTRRKRKALPPTCKAEKRLEYNNIGPIDAPPESKVSGGTTTRPALITNDHSVVHHVTKVLLGKGNETKNQHSLSIPTEIAKPYQPNQITDGAVAANQLEYKSTLTTSIVSGTDNPGIEEKTFDSIRSHSNSSPPEAHSNNTNDGLQTSYVANGCGGQHQGMRNTLLATTVIEKSQGQILPSASVIARYKQQQREVQLEHNFYGLADGIRAQGTLGSNSCESRNNDPPLPAETIIFHPLSTGNNPSIMADVTNHLRYSDERAVSDTKQSLPHPRGHIEQPKRMALPNPYAARHRTSL